MHPDAYAALGRYLNELTGRNPEWAPPIEAIHHVSVAPGWDSVTVLWSANAQNNSHIILWDGEKEFYADDTQGPDDPQRQVQQRNEAVMCLATFSYENPSYKMLKHRVQPVRSPLDDTFKQPEYEFTCTGEFGDPVFFLGDAAMNTAGYAFAKKVREYFEQTSWEQGL